MFLTKNYDINIARFFQGLDTQCWHTLDWCIKNVLTLFHLEFSQDCGLQTFRKRWVIDPLSLKRLDTLKKFNLDIKVLYYLSLRKGHIILPTTAFWMPASELCQRQAKTWKSTLRYWFQHIWAKREKTNEGWGFRNSRTGKKIQESLGNKNEAMNQLLHERSNMTKGELGKPIFFMAVERIKKLLP